MPNLAETVLFLDTLLRTAEISDYSGAWNGLQIENSGKVTRIGAAVDACSATIQAAAEREIDLLLVHHGLFWSGVQPVTGYVRRRLQWAFGADLAVYSAHLPLDLHPEIGNNVLFAQALGLPSGTPFFPSHGQPIGLQIAHRIGRAELLKRIERAVGQTPKILGSGPEAITQIGIVTGGAGGEIARAAEAGVDTFITGEGPQHSAILAEELGVNLILAGHYATETFGVCALAERLAQHFGVPWEYLDHPTGL